LYPFLGGNVLIVFLSGVLVDADHYLLYVFRKKDLSVKKCYDYHKDIEGLGKDNLEIFHTFEFWVLLLVLSFYYYLFWFVLLGVMFHMVLDWIDLYKRYYRIKKVRAWSLVRWMIRKFK